MKKVFIMAILLITAGACNTVETNNRPNVILILVDDMGFSDIGCYGSEIATPNIDKLGYNGLRFAQFYNAARCCPSRAALLTGLYPHQAGMGGMVDRHGRSRPEGPYQGWLNKKSVTIAEVLKKSGYQTYMAGKWHVGEDSLDWPLQRGFDKYFGLIGGACSYFEVLPGRTIVRNNQVCTALEDGFYMTNAITESAIQYIEEAITKENPFFLYLAYTAPHWPLHALPEKINKYKGKYLQGWDSIRKNRYMRQVEMKIFKNRWPLSPRDSIIPAWADVKGKEDWDLKMATYAAMMESVDDGIGSLMDKLTEKDQFENTLILFLSDNGACHETLEGRVEKDLKEFAPIATTIPVGEKGSYVAYGKEWANACNTPFRLYKHWTHEGGIATPLIVHYPKFITHGKISHVMGHVIDVMPTILEVTDSEYPLQFNRNEIQPAEGKSLAPILFGYPMQQHEALYWEHEESKAIRKGTWKLVSNQGSAWELYNMTEDRAEVTDLSEVHPDIVSALAIQYQAWADRVGVK